MDIDARLIQFLQNPKHYPDRTSKVIHIETHISHVFVGDNIVYKIKKPIDFGFLDFTTLSKRRLYCRKEVHLNSRLAKDTYLGVVPIYSNGHTYSFKKFSGSRIAEYAVKMRKIPHDCILYNLIEQGRPLYGELNETGKTLAYFHKNAKVYKGTKYGGLETIRSSTEENFQQILPFRGIFIDDECYHQIADYTRSFINKNKGIFVSRKKDGYIREGHGDLHSQHICLVDPPIIFDCIEFNEAFRIIDILQDIAFLFMDLEYRGRYDLSVRLLKSYTPHHGQNVDDELLRFYKIYRAVVRGKVEGFRAQSSTEEAVKQEATKAARDYFKLAEHYLLNYRKPFNPVVIMGLSGSGKSSIAKGFSSDWTILKSDEFRKKLSGIKPEKHVYREHGADIYASEITDKIYSLLLDEAVRHACAGKRIIVDATYLQSQQRLGFYTKCMEKKLNPFFIHCFAGEEFLRDRITKRMAQGNDVSDAHLDILKRQIEDREEPLELPYYRVLRLNTEDHLPNIINALKEFL